MRVVTVAGKAVYSLLFVNFLFIPITVAIGIFGAIDPAKVPHPGPNTLAVGANNGLFFASFVLGIYWMYRMKGLPWFAAAVLTV
jgi:uncharacterized transporter YbjL